MKKFYFLFKIDLNRELTLYSFNPPITTIGTIMNNSIRRPIIGNYNGRVLAIDNTDNGINYLKIMNDIGTIISDYKIDEINKYNSNIMLGGYIISDDPEIETGNIDKLDFNISKYFEIKEVDGNNKLFSIDIEYSGLDIDQILKSVQRNIKLNDLGI